MDTSISENAKTRPGVVTVGAAVESFDGKLIGHVTGFGGDQLELRCARGAHFVVPEVLVREAAAERIVLHIEQKTLKRYMQPASPLVQGTSVLHFRRPRVTLPAIASALFVAVAFGLPGLAHGASGGVDDNQPSTSAPASAPLMPPQYLLASGLVRELHLTEDGVHSRPAPSGSELTSGIADSEGLSIR